jgi:hypothetical protein
LNLHYPASETGVLPLHYTTSVNIDWMSIN